MMKRMYRSAIYRRLLFSGLASALALLVFGGAVLAGGWCRADPIVELEGEEVQIWVAIPQEYQSEVDGPISVTIAVPDEVDTELIFLDSGFNGRGETVNFIEGGRGDDEEFRADIFVSIPLANPELVVPVEVEVVYDGRSKFFAGTTDLTRASVRIDADD